MNSKSKFIQISAGRGPAECAWVVAQVLKKIMEFARESGTVAEVIGRNQGCESGTLNSCLLKVSGKGLNDLLGSWLGTIKWVGKSPYRKFHKRKNWFVGVSFIDESDQVSFHEKDLIFSTFRASGPGGQHRNKVETAVRTLHKPTKIAVTASNSKSQKQNKKAALIKMHQAIEQYQLASIQTRIDEQWREHLLLQRGNPVKVFEGRDFKEKRS